MKMRFITGLALLLSAPACFAQDGFMTGTATVHIDPDTSAAYSAALAGYGVPREGRFSLTWQPLQSAPDITALTATNGKMYAATSGGQWITGTLVSDTMQWKMTGKTAKLTALTTMNG